MMPQRSPAPTVNVMSRNRSVAPNSTATLDICSCVIARSRGSLPRIARSLRSRPLAPFVFSQSDRQSLRSLADLPDQGHPQHQRLLRKLIEPPFFGHARVPQSELEIGARCSIEQCVYTVSLGETPQFLRRRRSLCQIDEVRSDPALGE